MGCWCVSFADCVILEESLEESGYGKGKDGRGSGDS